MQNKIYLVFVLIILITESCLNDKTENDWNKSNLKGKVKSFTEFSYKAETRFGKIEKGIRDGIIYSLFTDYQSKYSVNGDLIENNKYNTDGSLSHKTIYKYNKNRILINRNIYEKSGKLINKYLFKYDKKNNKIEEIIYDSNGKLNSKLTFKYDDFRNIIEQKNFTKDGSLESKYSYKYKYDNNKNIVEENSYGETNYNSESTVFNEKNRYKYDKNGKKIEWENIRLDGKFLIKYDENGNMIEDKNYNSDGSLKSKDSYKYEYDEKGNWIKQIHFENNIPKYILEREYEYYD